MTDGQIEKIVVAVGDPHAKYSNVAEIQALGLKVRDIVLRLKERNPNSIIIVVILGDLSDTFERVHILALRSIVHFLRKITEAKVPVYYLVGNHDMINNQVFLEDLHAFVGIQMPYLRIIDRPISDLGFIFCPYTPPGRLKEALAPWIEKNAHLTVNPSLLQRDEALIGHAAVFCHQEFRGAKMGPIESKVGDEWPADFPLACSGHIHDRQWLQPNVLYVGEPMDSAYGNTQARTISILLFRGQYGEVFQGEKAFDLGLPRKITVDLQVAAAKDYKVPENCHVRVNLIGTTAEHIAFKKTKEYTELSKLVKIVPKFADKVVVRANRERVSYLQLLKNACETESSEVKAIFDELTQSKAANASSP